MELNVSGDRSGCCEETMKPEPPASFLRAASFSALRRFYTSFITLSLASTLLAVQSAGAQQPWSQSTPSPNSRYAQADSNYVPPSPYAQPSYGGQAAYAQQQGYTQQQPQYASQAQPDFDPGQDQTGADYPGPNPSQTEAQPFVAEQLEQLVAPIALYPDNLVAQILAAATYPAQVVAADNWLRSQGAVPPEQIAAGANAQTTWDPSIKALTAFPQVLDLMNHDIRWTTDLGNAYYNQPQDVLQTIQVMRRRAQAAGTLQSSPQEQVSSNQGYIQLAPANPQVVYVPTYNPWAVYGAPVAPYPGFSWLGAIGSVLGDGLRFGSGIGLAAFSNTPFGWAGWLLNWLTSSIFFNHSPYYSNSMSVAHWGGRDWNRSWGSGRGGYGAQNGGMNRRPTGFGRSEQSYGRYGNVYAERGFSRPAVRTGQNDAFNRYAERPILPAREQAYAHASGYGQSFYGSQPRAALPRPMTNYGGSQFNRSPSYSEPRNSFAQHAYAPPRSYGGERSYMQAYRSPEHSGGFHLFGGGRSGGGSHASFHESKAPKMSGGGGHHSGGGHSSHHGR